LRRAEGVVFVEPAAALLPERAGGDQIAEHRRRATLVVADASMEDVGDRQHRVEADEVGDRRSKSA
jgi:hypothetical protein